MSLLIEDVTVIDGISEQPIEGQSIWVEEGRIKAMGRNGAFETPHTINTLSGRGKYVIPGLMDANLHLMGAIRLEQLLRYEHQFNEVITEAAQITLRSGLTTVFDVWGPRIPLTAARDDIAARRVIGSRIFCAGNVIGLDGPLSPDFFPKALEATSDALAQRVNSLFVENVGPDLTWMTPAQVVMEVRAYVRRGIDFANYSSSDHRGGDPSAFLLFSPRVQSLIVEEAHRAGLPATAHSTSVEALWAAIEAGNDIVHHCNITGPVPIPEATLELLKSRKTAVVVFPFTQRRFDYISRSVNGLTRRFWASAHANCRALIQSGASLLLGTDAIVQPNSGTADAEDNLMELGQGHFHWLKAMEEMGCPPMQMLKAATRNIAVAYGKDQDLGSLAPGKIADLLILDENPLEAAKNYRTIHMVIKEGQVIDTGSLPMRPLMTKPAPPPPDTVKSYGRFAPSRYPSC